MTIPRIAFRIDPFAKSIEDASSFSRVQHKDWIKPSREVIGWHTLIPQANEDYAFGLIIDDNGLLVPESEQAYFSVSWYKGIIAGRAVLECIGAPPNEGVRVAMQSASFLRKHVLFGVKAPVF